MIDHSGSAKVSSSNYGTPMLPKEQEQLLNKPPKELGKALARRHLDMVREAVREWAQENPSPKGAVKETKRSQPNQGVKKPQK